MFKIKDAYFYHMSEIVKNYLSMSWYNLTNQALNRHDASKIDITVSVVRDPLPLVVLIGGVGGSGKSTFIQYCRNHMDGVHEESTIDCCKEVVNYMAGLEERNRYSSGLKHEINLKTDQYRTLLNKLKTAWCEIDDGPNELVVNRVLQLFESEESPSVIFINVREPEQIDHLKKKLETDAACIVLTLVVNRNEPDQFTNVADRTTLDYDYDLYVNNTSDLEALDTIATQFCLAVHSTNREMQRLYVSAVN